MVGIELVKNKETKEAFEWTERVGVQYVNAQGAGYDFAPAR